MTNKDNILFEDFLDDVTVVQPERASKRLADDILTADDIFDPNANDFSLRMSWIFNSKSIF